MTKLNWRDANKELPKEVSELIIYFTIDMSKKYKPMFFASFDGVNFWVNDVEYGVKIVKVTHWLPINEIPLPKE